MINGQLSIFDLEEREENKNESTIDFSIEQLKTIEQLKEKKWLEYSLYECGTVIFITIENNIRVVPMEDTTKAYFIKYKYRTYFIRDNGEIDCCGLGVTRWQDPIKTIVND